MSREGRWRQLSILVRLNSPRPFPTYRNGIAGVGLCARGLLLDARPPTAEILLTEYWKIPQGGSESTKQNQRVFGRDSKT